jgi:GNAT superfamily N-acetyltransferase
MFERLLPQAFHQGVREVSAIGWTPRPARVDHAGMDISWRGEFSSEEANRLHAEAFGTRLFDDTEWNWRALVDAHSLGWVTARDGVRLVGFANVPWDGLVHAWLQDVMVAADARHRGVGRQVVATAQEGARAAGCEWLHVDFDDELAPFYLHACGFRPATAGLMQL